MNWMDKLERKWGRHAVANLSRYFVLAQVIGYVVQLTAPGRYFILPKSRTSSG